MQLDGKVALVTGGNSGIGLGTAKRLADEGAFVHITGRDPATLERAAHEIGDLARAVQADVTNREDMLRVASTIEAEHGSLDIIFANAGGGTNIALEAITEEDFDSEFDVNVKGVLFTVRAGLDRHAP